MIFRDCQDLSTVLAIIIRNFSPVKPLTANYEESMACTI